jgi:hypothetical protein
MVKLEMWIRTGFIGMSLIFRKTFCKEVPDRLASVGGRENPPRDATRDIIMKRKFDTEGDIGCDSTVAMKVNSSENSAIPSVDGDSGGIRVGKKRFLAEAIMLRPFA